MALIIDVMILCDDPAKRQAFGTVRREYDDCNLTPMAGMEIEDPAWKEPREIKKVCLNPIENYYYIIVEDERRGSWKDCEDLKEIYKSHGWKALNE